MKKLNEYLVLNFPAIWNSRVVYLLTVSIITSSFFFLFIDFFDVELKDLKPNKYGNRNESDDQIYGYPVLFLSGLFVLIWLYFQYQHKPFIKKYSLLETLKGSFLNLLCLSLILIPLYPLFTLTVDDPNDLKYLVDATFMLIFVFVIPIIFLPFIIKSYTLSEVVLILMALIFYVIFWVLLEEGFDFDFKNLYLVGLVHYIFILIYLIVKLTMRKYNTIDKWLIFLLVTIAPWFMSFLLEPFLRSASRTSARPIPDLAFHDNPAMYFMTFLCSFFFLVFLTWYVTKSLRKPMVIK